MPRALGPEVTLLGLDRSWARHEVMIEVVPRSRMSARNCSTPPVFVLTDSLGVHTNLSLLGQWGRSVWWANNRITRVMERMAVLAGDVGAMVLVDSRGGWP